MKKAELLSRAASALKSLASSFDRLSRKTRQQATKAERDEAKGQEKP